MECTSDGMIVTLDLTILSYVDTNTMTLTDTSCTPKHVNKTHAIIEAPLEGCGTTHNYTKDYLYYYNSIKMKREKEGNSTIITREHNATLFFSCAYDRSAILSVTSYSPRRKLVYTRTGT